MLSRAENYNSNRKVIMLKLMGEDFRDPQNKFYFLAEVDENRGYVISSEKEVFKYQKHREEKGIGFYAMEEDIFCVSSGDLNGKTEQDILDNLVDYRNIVVGEYMINYMESWIDGVPFEDLDGEDVGNENIDTQIKLDDKIIYNIFLDESDEFLYRNTLSDEEIEEGRRKIQAIVNFLHNDFDMEKNRYILKDVKKR